MFTSCPVAKGLAEEDQAPDSLGEFDHGFCRRASCSEQKERMIDTSAIYIYRVYYRYMYICIHVYKLLIIYQNNSAA